MRTVESIKFRVEQLLEYLTLGQAKPADLAQWVVDLEPVAGKEAGGRRTGRATREHRQAVALGAFLDQYVEWRTVKPATKEVWSQTTQEPKEALREEQSYWTSITEGDADGFKEWLLKESLASTTVFKTAAVCKAVFCAAVRHKLTRRPIHSRR